MVGCKILNCIDVPVPSHFSISSYHINLIYKESYMQKFESTNKGINKDDIEGVLFPLRSSAAT